MPLGTNPPAHQGTYWEGVARGQASHSAHTTPAIVKPPWERNVDMVMSMMTNDKFFPIPAVCKRKQRQLENRGSSVPATSMIGNLIIHNQDTPINIDQDRKNFGTWEDFVDGWLHYILLMTTMGYELKYIQDRIITLRWLTESDYQPQSKIEFMYKLRSKFPQTRVRWMQLINNNSMFMVEWLVKFDSSSQGHRFERQANPRNPKKLRPSPDKKHLKGPKQTPTLNLVSQKAAQVKALKALNVGAATPQRLCYSSSSNKPCNVNPCTYAHICIKCLGAHSKKDCTKP
jgi:hypothetical protein